MHILVVEDEPKIRDVLTAYFKKEGWEVDCTSNGYEAVSKFDLHQHDLVMLLIEFLRQRDARVLLAFAENFLVHARHAIWCFAQPIAIGIFANSFEDQPHRFTYFF